MAEYPSPLEYHYKTSLKLDYFILSVDIAILGWTVVNTNWLPSERIYIWLMAAFWILIILSVISGIIRQLHNGTAFGINHQTLYSGELANAIERSSPRESKFINQQTGESIQYTELLKIAGLQREKEKGGKESYIKLSKQAQFYGNAATSLLAVALFLFVIIKLSILID